MDHKLNIPEKIAQYMSRDKDKYWIPEELKQYVTNLYFNHNVRAAKKVFDLQYKKVSKGFSAKMDFVEKILKLQYGTGLIKKYKQKKDGDGWHNLIIAYKVKMPGDELETEEMIEHQSRMIKNKQTKLTQRAKNYLSTQYSLLKEVCTLWNTPNNRL